MDSFHMNFDAESMFIHDTTSSNSHLDWTAFQSTVSPVRSCQPDDAVAPNNRSVTTAATATSKLHDEDIFFEMEQFFHDAHQETQPQGIAEATPVNGTIPDQMMNVDKHPELPHRAHLPLVIKERSTARLPAPSAPRVSSSRSQCYHKLPDRAVTLMQDWYNAHLDDPYPRSPDKKRFTVEGNITAQQCRSWFANRRQRLKHVKRNQSKATSSRPVETRLPQVSSVNEPPKTPEHCHYCQQHMASTPAAATVNVIINHQTVEQLIHNSLRKLLYPSSLG